MQNILAVFVGITMFLVILAINCFKRAHGWMKEQDKKSRIRNICGMAMSFAVSITIYYIMSRMAGMHYKLCCAYKSWVISLFLCAIYKQFFGMEKDVG